MAGREKGGPRASELERLREEVQRLRDLIAHGDNPMAVAVKYIVW